jgi:hypothetical protein
MENRETFYMAFPYTVVATFVISAVLWLALGRVYGISFALGSTTMLFTMSLLNRSSRKIVVQTDKVAAQRMAIVNYVVRYAFYAIVLLLAGISANFDLLATGAGLFLFKIVFYIIHFIVKRGDKND